MDIYPKKNHRGSFIWPFPTMQVGETVRVAATHKARAKSSAWNYTARNWGYYFSFAKDAATGDLLITRTAEKPAPPNPNAWWEARKDDPIYMLLVGE